MKALHLLQRLKAAGVALRTDGETLKVNAPRGALTAQLRAEIAEHKADLIELLAGGAGQGPALEPIADRPDKTPLSPGQARLWKLVAREAASERYHLVHAFRVHGPLDRSAFTKAVGTLVERHEMLRSVVRSDGSNVFTELLPLPLDVVEWVEVPPRVTPAWAQEHIATEAQRPFKLSEEPLVRVSGASLSPDDHLLVFVMHHLVSDGWSFEVFFDELELAYSALITGAEPALEPVALQYGDWVAWQQAQRTDDRRRADARHWAEVFRDRPASLPIGRARSVDVDVRRSASLGSELVARVEELAAKHETTAFAVVLSAYAAVLATATGTTDVIVCSPSLGRDREPLLGVIGYLNKVLPLRVPVDREAPFAALLDSTKRVIVEALGAQELPLQEIAALPELGQTPLTRAMFSYHGAPLRGLRLGPLGVQAIGVPNRTADFDLSMTVVHSGEEDGSLAANLGHREGVLEAGEDAVILEQLATVLDRATQQPQEIVASLTSEVGRIRAASRSASVARPERTEAPSADSFEMLEALPDDPLELQLAVLWERVLDVRPIDPSDDFFLLGGDSLRAVELLDLIEQEMGHQVPLATLAEFPTVRGLAEAFRRGGWAPAVGSLIPMYANVDGTPVVLVHSFEGHVFLFNELARRVGETNPTYGLQARGLDGVGGFDRTVEDMAAHYLELIDRQFGDQRVALVGMCFSNSVALEMARRRAETGNPVELILLDGAWEHLMVSDDRPVQLDFAGRMRDRAVRGTGRVRFLIDGLRRALSPSAYTRREGAVRRRTARAWRAYHPAPFSGTATLVRAERTANDPTKAWHIRAAESVALGGVDVIVVPGHHFTILREPDVGGVAEAVVGAVRRPVNAE